MKSLIIMVCLVSLSSAFAQNERQRKEILRERVNSEFGFFEPKEVGLCRYELVGTNVPMEKVFEEEDMNFSKCESKAVKALEGNNVGFTKVLIKHSSKENWVVIGKKKK